MGGILFRTNVKIYSILFIIYTIFIDINENNFQAKLYMQSLKNSGVKTIGHVGKTVERATGVVSSGVGFAETQ